jgi:hypothetical protein
MLTHERFWKRKNALAIRSKRRGEINRVKDEKKALCGCAGRFLAFGSFRNTPKILRFSSAKSVETAKKSAHWAFVKKITSVLKIA